MARYVRHKTQYGTSSTSFTPTLPAHENGDLILAFMGNDWTNNGYSTSTTGWTKEEEITGTANGACFSFYATSSSSTNPTFTTSTARGWATVIVVVKDAPTSAAIDVSASSLGSFHRSTTETVTTTVNNALLLEYVMLESQSKQLYFEPDVNSIAILNASDVSFNHNAILGWHVQPSSGVSTAHNFANSFSSNNGIKLTIAIKDDGNGNFPGYVDPAVPPADMLTPWAGSDSLAYYDDGTKKVDPTSLIGTINGNTTTYFAVDGLESLKIYPNIRSCGFDITSSSEWGKPLVWQRGLGNTWDLSGDSVLSFTGKSLEDSVDFNTGARYIGVGSGDSSNVATAALLFQYESTDAKVRMDDGSAQFVVQPSRTADETYGTIDLTSITKLFQSSYVTASGQDHGLSFLYKLKTMNLIGGSTTHPCDFGVAASHARTTALNTVRDQGGSAASQYFCTQNIQVGNGTDATYWDSSFQAIEYPAAYNSTDINIAVNVNSAVFKYSIKATSGDTVTMNSCTFNMGNYHKWEIDSATHNSDIYTFTGLNVLNATVTLQNKPLINYSGITFSGCKEIVHNGADLSDGVTIANSADTYAITVTSQAELENLQNCDFQGNNYSIRITGNHGGSTWSLTGSTVSGGTGSYDIRYEGTGTLTIEADSGSGWVQGRAEATVGTLTISAPTLSLTVNSNIAASDIKIFNTGTQTVEASTTGTTLNTTNAGTYDITVMKAGYLPQRQTGITLSSTSVTVNVTLVEDPIYDGTHGLTYTTDFSYNRSTQKLTLSTRQEGRDFYSALIDNFISQSSLDNTAFDFQAVGPDSIFFLNDAEIIDSGSEDNWKGAGIRYLNSSSVVTAEWCSVKSAGTIPAGATGEYQQQDGSGTTDLRATGAVDQIVQIYGDATHGNFDYRGHLVIKYQVNGYREVRADVPDLAGVSTLEPFEYSVALEPVAISAATGDPAITITVTDHGASPVTWNSKDFSITVQYSGADSGEDILRELNYNLSLDTTYQGKDPFNWPEMAIEAGSAYETLRGITEGGAGATLKGVRVVNGSGDPHPDFTRFQADDGTYYVVPVTANGSITGIVSGSRVRIYNETTATETYNNVPGTSYAVSYTDGTTYSNGDVIKIYITQTSGTTAQLPFTTTVVATSNGWSALADQEDDTVYNQYAIDGSGVTKFSADYVDDEVDLVVASNFSADEMYAWWAYNLTTSQGIADFFGGLTAQDEANLLINNSVVNIKLDNTTASNVYQTDNVRIYRADSAYPVKNPTTGGGGIDIVWRDRVYIAVTGSGVTAQDKTDIKNLVFDEVVEGTETFKEQVRLMRAEAAGKLAVSGTTVSIRDATDSKDRIVATVDESGQRTSVTTDAS